jgi:hypothetical protein
MTAEELFNELLALRDLYGSLENVPVSVFMNHERLDINLVDHFSDQKNGETVLHSIDLNVKEYGDTLKYRVVYNTDSFEIITEKGGVASCYKTPENFVTNFFCKSLNECDTDKDIWEQLAEGKVYFKDWEKTPTVQEAIENALEWLVFPAPSKWVEDKTLYTDFFKS